MADSNTTSEGNATAPAKKRSSVERAIVWGGILLLLILVACEFRARQAHKETYNGLMAEMGKSDASGTPLIKETVDKKITWFMQPLGDSHEINQDPNTKSYISDREEIYTFRGLVQTHKIYLYYSPKGLNDAPPEVIEVALEAVEKAVPIDTPQASKADELASETVANPDQEQEDQEQKETPEAE